MKDEDQFYTTQDAASLSGLSPQTIREYEKCSLITPRRDSVGNRLFTLADIGELKRIAKDRAQRHGRPLRRRLVVSTTTG